MLFQHAANSSMNRINTLSYAPRNLGKLSVLGNERKRTGMRKIGELTAQLRFLEELKRSQELHEFLPECSFILPAFPAFVCTGPASTISAG